MDGTGREQHRGKLRVFFGTLAGEAQRATQRHQGQRADAPGPGMLSYPETPSLNLRVVREMLPRQRFGPDELLRLLKEEQLRNELPA